MKCDGYARCDLDVGRLWLFTLSPSLSLLRRGTKHRLGALLVRASGGGRIGQHLFWYDTIVIAFHTHNLILTISRFTTIDSEALKFMREDFAAWPY